MKALSIQQPWAYCITNGTKRIENRTWATRYRGLLLIHAGKSAQRGVEQEIHLDSPEMDIAEMRCAPRGAIVGVCRIVDCVSIQRFGQHPYDTTNEFAQSQRVWAGGPYCFVLHDPKPFAAPIPYKGELGLFEIPDSVVAEQLWALGIQKSA